LKGRGGSGRTARDPERVHAPARGVWYVQLVDSRSRAGGIGRIGRRAAAWLVVPVLAVLPACSHTTPYLNPKLAPQQPVGLTGPPLYRLILVGDAGAPHPGGPVLGALQRWAAREAGRTLVVFLGDNAYPEGITAARRADAEMRLTHQVDAVAAGGAEALFVPGNHDWANGAAEGHTAILAQEAFIGSRARFLPSGGCPGPELLDLPQSAPVVRLILLDTQWWLHRWDKPRAACPAGTPDEVVARLRAALRTDLPIVVGAHHPPVTHGPHGGFFDWRAHVFPLRALKPWLWIPLPGLGSAYPLLRAHVMKGDQNFNSPSNIAMWARLDEALRSHQGPSTLLFAAGHEHSLQILRGTSVEYVLVSGAGSEDEVTPVGSGTETVFAHEHPGFMVLDVTEQRLVISVVEPVGGGDAVLATVPVASRRP
jgi:hypothetical protein